MIFFLKTFCQEEGYLMKINRLGRIEESISNNLNRSKKELLTILELLRKMNFKDLESHELSIKIAKFRREI